VSLFVASGCAFICVALARLRRKRSVLDAPAQIVGANDDNESNDEEDQGLVE